MKALFTILTALLLTAPSRAADEIDEAVSAIGLLPSQRSGQHVTPQERNPFATRPKEINKIVQSEETETQESHIRAIFKLIEVTGVRRDGHGRLMALAGDLILREGEEVKPVMLDQTETLVVSKVGPEQVELTFIETKDSTQPRMIPLPVKNKVKVSQKLFGQPKGGRDFYTVTGKKATDPGVAAAMASVQQVPGGASGSASAWQAPPVSIVSAMAGLTGLFPRVPSGDNDRSTDTADPASPGAQETPAAEPTPGSPSGNIDTKTAVEPSPVPGSPASGGSLSAPPVFISRASSPAETKPSALAPSATGAPALAPVPVRPTPSGTAAPTVPAPERVSPPTYLRRHGERPTAEPEARAARPAVPPPASGTSPGVVE